MDTKRSLCLAFVTETFPPEVNGVAMTVSRMVTGLLARGHRIILTRPRQHRHDQPAQSGSYHEQLAPGMVCPLYRDLRLGLPSVRLLLKAWREHRPDLVVVVTEGPLGWSALRAAKQLGIPALTEFHTNFHRYSEHYGFGWLKGPVTAYLRRFHNNGQLALVPTSEIAEELGRIGLQRVETVARGVDTQLYHPERRSDALRQHWGVSPQTQVVAYVGRLAAEKNLPLVLQAFAAMREIRPDSRMVWVGDGPERAALAAAHPEHVFCGIQRHEALASHYASADAFLFASETETYGNVTLEAMASGLGVVAYNYAAARNHVRHRCNGLVAPLGDEEEFIELARYAASYPSVMRDLGTAARRSVEAIGWDAIIDRFETILSQLLQGRASLPPHPNAALAQ
ncbi:glycosyltransferase family 4 protein [Parachitinimonas caeni]|uniref:Glycosyltransferase family 1 protein n=1 Tax=Parachitinimonas caeni TaxID=3031301 RepID=A0ABT7DS10_9NEIS|nr:glycosyltransferase family 1 protein [Parachitinimonas caeni]MDK2122856.1 glycosyltransferase family 1 protein [Parachitinimonas caeni]